MKSLTVGMATFRDATRARWTAITSLLAHPLIKEVVIVNNDPGGPGSQELQSAAGSDHRVKYFEYDGPSSTSQPRNAVFEHATNDHVICVDSHVFLLPGAVDALAKFYAEMGEDCQDLIHGPMWTERGTLYATHFNDQWRAEMWGTWGTAWIAPNGTMFSPYTPGTNEIAFLSMPWPQRDLTTDDIGIPSVGGWAAHERTLESYGCVRANDQGKPFEIPGTGFGAFACRKDAWLSRPFHRDMRGFGGEELSHHCGVRKAGRKVWCVPEFKWWHDFYREGIPYSASTWDKVRNYYLQFKEYGLKMAPIIQNFIKAGAVRDSEWERYWKDHKGNPMGVHEWIRPYVVSGTMPPYSELLEHTITTRKLNQTEWDQMQAGADWPRTPVTGHVPKDRKAFNVSDEQIRAMLAENERLYPNGNLTEIVNAPAEPVPFTPAEPSPALDVLYQQKCAEESDINEHLPRLRELAAQCDTVVELGTRYATSTVALLAGQPRQLMTVDIHPSPSANGLKPMAGRTDFRVIQADSTQVEIPDCDLLFIDTIHTAEQVARELSKHVVKCRRFIVFHDTVSFGEAGEGEKTAGINHAIRAFLQKNPEWFTVSWATNNNGLAVLSKNPADRPEKPIHVPGLLPGGVGSEFKELASMLGVNPAPNCGCNQLSAQMDFGGVAWVKQNRPMILDRMRQNATHYKWTDTIRAAKNAVLSGLAFKLSMATPIESLLDEAIRRAEAKGLT